MSEPRRSLCIQNPVAGRIVGVVWDLLVTVVTLLLIPLGCLILAAALVHTSLLLMVAAVPLVAVCLFSLVVGVVWNFRRHMGGSSTSC